MLRAHDPKTKLSEVQLAVAREYGFPSWRKLKAHVELVRAELRELAPAAASQGSAAETISPDDPDLAQLLVAVEQGNTQAAAEILARRPSLARAHGPDGQTPLHVAAQCNDPRLGVLLRKQISDALYMACRNAHEEVFRFLLTKKPDLSFKAYMGGTPLHWAYFGGSRRIIELFEQAGADTTARDDAFHCTPRLFGICAPARWGFAFLVQKRLTADPSLASQTDGRTSPLHEAARSGSAEVVRLLLDHAADPTLRDAAGKTPPEIAADHGHHGVVDILQKGDKSN